MSVHVAVLDGALAPGAVPWGGEGSGVWLVGADPAALTEHLRSEPAETVVVLARSAQQRAARLSVTVAAGAYPDVRIGMRSASASVLALAAAAATAVEGADDGADVVRTAGLLLDAAVSGVWLERVTRLQHPSPSPLQHLRSVLPGGPGYVVSFGAEPAVRRGPVELPADGSLLVGADPDDPRLASTVAALGVPQPPVPTEAAVDVRAAYGSAGAEFVLLPTAVQPSQAARSCLVCAESSHGSACPFCHVVLSSLEHVA